MAEAVVRLAVWGAGIMGERVARCASLLPGVVVSAVIDVDERRAGEVADAFSARRFDTLQEACAHTAIDAVYISLPNALHQHACIEAAGQGLDVLIEKPLTTTVQAADEVARAAADSGCFWMVGFSYRFRAEWQRAREIVHAGVIGEPYFVSDNVFEALRTTPAWYWQAEAGGGTLSLQSHHVFDRWEWLFRSQVTELSAQTISPAGAEVDFAVSITAHLGSTLTATSALSLSLGYDAPLRTTFTIQGARGKIQLDETRRLTVVTEAGITEEDHSDDDWLASELSAFVAGVRGDSCGQPSLEAGRRAVQLAEAAMTSTSRRGWVSTRPLSDRSKQ